MVIDIRVFVFLIYERGSDMDTAIKTVYEALSRNAVVRALFENYESLYVVDAETSAFKCYHESDSYRTLSIDGEQFEFSQGFTELHTESYRRILSGEGFRISEARPCIEIVSQIRTSKPIGLVGDYHPLAKLPLARHPFGWDETR